MARIVSPNIEKNHAEVMGTDSVRVVRLGRTTTCVATDGRRIVVGKFTPDEKTQKNESPRLSDGEFAANFPRSVWLHGLADRMPRRERTNSAMNPEHAWIDEAKQEPQSVSIQTTDGAGTCAEVSTTKFNPKFVKWQDSIPRYELADDVSDGDAVSIKLGAKMFAELVKVVADCVENDAAFDVLQLIIPKNPARPVEMRAISDMHGGRLDVRAFQVPAMRHEELEALGINERGQRIEWHGTSVSSADPADMIIDEEASDDNE